MPKRTDVLLLEDILEAIVDIENFTEGLSYEKFASDKKTFNAVIRSFTIIGEAANRLSSEVASQNKGVDWYKVIAFRNRLVHEYFGVDYEMVWQVIKNFLSKLKQEVQLILSAK